MDTLLVCCVFFFSSRRRHTRSDRDWSSDVCSSDLTISRCIGFMIAEVSPAPIAMVRKVALMPSRAGRPKLTLDAPQVVFTRSSFLRRSEEHTSELQSRSDLVCRLLLEKKKSWSMRS